MKRIGIITFHRAHNYGAILQTYALQKVLSKDYDVKIIDYRNEDIEKDYKIFNIDTQNIKSAIKSITSSIIYMIKNINRFKKFDKFIKENLILTDQYNSESELKENYPKLDVYITGSDQVWNYNISGKKIDSYTLKFGDKSIKKLSYAASIGTNTFDESHKEKYIENIGELDFISVREENAKEYLKDIINKPLEVTLDPTLLLNRNQWDELLEKTKENNKYILGYAVSKESEYYKTLNYISDITRMKIVHFNKRNNKIKNIYKNAYATGPVEFLYLIKNAEYVIATSFHATVFSIIFHKKFWIIPPKKVSSRITNLLEKLGIQDRIITSLDELKKKDYDKNIDYEEVERKLDIERAQSIDWLKNAIDG